MNFSKHRKAIFIKTLLKKIEKFVDTSECACGSQLEKGHIGIFTPNPTIKNIKIINTSFIENIKLFKFLILFVFNNKKQYKKQKHINTPPVWVHIVVNIIASVFL